MNKSRLTFVLLASVLLLCGCSSQENSADTPGNSVSETDAPAAAAQAENGYATAEEAYSAYLDVCFAGDADVLYTMYSADEKAAAPNVSAEYLELDEEGYAAYLELMDDSKFQASLKNYMKTLHDSMDSFGDKDSTWSILPGISDGTEDPQAFAAATGLDVQGLVSYNYYFIQEDKEDGAAITGKRVSVVQIGDKWYPSFVYENKPDFIF